jgi:MinD superfamily P-loop ATPase
MRELVVCSGKGGTGKTSIVASFAVLASEPVLVDCDVDAANLHLILSPRTKYREKYYGGRVAKIDPDLCMGCGTCFDLCRYGAISEYTDPDGSCSYRVDPLACEGCGVCVHFCPERAIEFPRALSGEWFVSDTRHGPLVHGRLGIAAENSGKLVSRIRKKAREVADLCNSQLILVDGPPGIGCPVIASITGADSVLVVTEPTKSALHDLARVADLAVHFRIETRVCINKCDINPKMTEEIHRYCREKGVEVVGVIPFDTGITAAQLEGRTVVENGSSPSASAIRAVWDRLKPSFGN